MGAITCDWLRIGADRESFDTNFTNFHELNCNEIAKRTKALITEHRFPQASANKTFITAESGKTWRHTDRGKGGSLCERRNEITLKLAV
jgi:hypothetical protein